MDITVLNFRGIHPSIVKVFCLPLFFLFLWLLYFLIFNNDHRCLSWTRIMRATVLDTGREESFRWAISEMAPIVLTDVEQPQFEQFFNRKEKVDFIQEYLAGCIGQQATGTPKTLGATLIGDSTYGFGVAFTMALNVYLIAQDPDVNRTFEILESSLKSSYSPLSGFFEDFGADSPCPLYTNLDGFSSADRDDLLQPKSFGIDLNRVTWKFRVFGCNQSVFPYPAHGQAWHDFRDTIDGLVIRDGTPRVFAAQTKLVQALWSPKPFLQTLLKFLWKKLRSNEDGYFGVHLRRSDKITNNEMEDISMERYLAELDTVCRLVNGTCRRNVFVLHDEQAAYLRLKHLGEGRFHFHELPDLLADPHMDRVRSVILGGQRGGNATSWQRHTRELVVSLTLLAMADRVVCTHSSNLCRIVALIKGDLSRVHSLDRGWFAMHL